MQMYCYAFFISVTTYLSIYLSYLSILSIYLVDDIEDNSKLRRGVPVAHSIYGIASTINTANYVYFMALERCQALGSREAMDIFIREMLNLHRGQGQDILWRDSCYCPTGKREL